MTMIERNNVFADALARVLAPVVGDARAREFAASLISRYYTLEDVITAPVSEISALTNKNAALFIKLLGYAKARRGTDAFVSGRTYSQAEIVEHLFSYFVARHVETVYLIMLDSDGKVIGMQSVCEGTVNASEILPRKLIEVAMAENAAAVILAHNHPHGLAEPSNEDRAMTASLTDVFRLAGIELKYHVIIAGHHHCIIPNPFMSEIRH